MINFLTLGQNIPFSVALMLLIMIAVLEVLSLFLGSGLSHFFHGICSDMEFHLNVQEAGAQSLMWKVLTWFQLGQVPVFILLLLFLSIFGISGLVLQHLSQKFFGVLLPAWLASIVTLILSFSLLRVSAGFLSCIIPKDETMAVSQDSFIGRVALITLGNARVGYAAGAKVKDQYDKYHYIMVEPDMPGEVYYQGEEVLIVRRKNSKFYVIEKSKSLN